MPASLLAAAVLDDVMGTANKRMRPVVNSVLLQMAAAAEQSCVLLAVTALCSVARPNVRDGGDGL